MKSIVKLLIALVAILLLLFFTIQNPQSVDLQLFGWPAKAYKAHLSVVIFVSFAVGLLVGTLLKGGKKSSGGGASKTK